MQKSGTLLWFCSDLRLDDNAALASALKRNEPIYPVYIWSPEDEGNWPMGGASQWWLHHALRSLGDALEACGLKLIIREGSAKEVLKRLLQETQSTAVFWNRRYWPNLIKRDTAIKAFLKDQGIEAQSFNSSLLHEPFDVKNKTGKPFQVFTPFWKHCLALDKESAVKLEWRKLVTPNKWPKSERINVLNLLPNIKWDKSFYDEWDPTLEGAEKSLKLFTKKIVEDYKTLRDFPAKPGTSRLSPYLRFGQVGPRQIWNVVSQSSACKTKGAQVFLSEVGWREFAYHLVYHFPATPEKPLRPNFLKFPWKKNKKQLKAWQKGQTGYPIIDAGMRQLWQTGWMHNRVRMIVGSFLVKNLLQPWQEGASWFWDTLVDADLASNTLGWQWVGGCGADAAPYFRIFNPVLQGEKFDPDGNYVKQFVPELKQVPAKFIHKPWEASSEVLSAWNVKLGKDYPAPIVDLRETRDRALDAYNAIKSG